MHLLLSGGSSSGSYFQKHLFLLRCPRAQRKFENLACLATICLFLLVLMQCVLFCFLQKLSESS